MTKLELWNGVRNQEERLGLLKLDRVLPKLPITAAVWEEATVYASRARATGITVPAADVLIFACAKHYGVRIEHQDKHYELLETVK